MRQIKYLIWMTWFFPVLLLLSPLHDFSNRANPVHVLLVAAAVAIISFGFTGRQVQITRSAFRDSFVRNGNLILVAALLCGTVVTIASVVSSGGGLRENRELFESSHVLYNYLFVTTVFSAVMLSVSSGAPLPHRILARLTWLLCGLLLLLTGNRQFVFFSLIFVTIYFLGISVNPAKLFVKVLFGAFVVVFLAIVFSILRLDYIQAEDLGEYGRYMSLLTGATCEGADMCDTWLEAVYQLLYAYLGMNYTGLTYAIDYFETAGGFPLGSTSVPVIYRRLESAGLAGGIQAYIADFDGFISRVSGGEYAHFFMSMFGTIALETGLLGIMVTSALLTCAVWLLSRHVARGGSETAYLLFAFVCSCLVFGIMQFPFTEPFLFFAFINILVHCAMVAASRRTVQQ